MENVIQLKKKNTLVFEIVDENGNKTGEKLEFDMEDIELPLKYQQCLDEHKRNAQRLQMQFVAIDKKEDHKGKKILSKNEEEKLKALKEYYQSEMESLDKVLGFNGCKKLLNGREPYYSMFDDINDVLEPILPKLQIHTNDIVNRIKDKYKNKEENVIE